jgi:dTDP-4-dehydrorhamnose reductase
MRQARRQSVDARGLSHKELDITNKDAVRSAMRGAEVAINCAAFADVDQSETREREAFAVNCDGARILAEEATRAGVGLLHISTDFVFDGEKGEPYVEDDPVNPPSVYARSKAAGEAAVANAAPRSLIVRTSWVYGATSRGFVANLIKWARERDSVEIVADQRGTPTDVDELAKGLLSMASHARHLPRSFAWGTYHLAGPDVATRLELAEATLAIAARYGVKTPRIERTTLAAFPAAAKRPLNSALDTRKVKAQFGIALTPWRSALERLLSEHFSAGG